MSDLEGRCRRLLGELGLASPHERLSVEPLSGGVASDIALVRIADRKVCVKFALAKLKTAADWFAPIHRNAAEYAWLHRAAQIAPENAIEVYGRSESSHGFAMEFLQGDDIYLWKAALLSEAPDRGEAARVGALLGRIHAASVEPDFDRTPFDNRSDFHALRLEPYLIHTARSHGDLRIHFDRLVDDLHIADRVLVHGDASPKNILLRGQAPILLDAECATMGDASFDPAFCLNHIVLKAIHLPDARTRYLQNAQGLWQAYARWIVWESKDEVEARICRLLPALMLARIDGKSPVEYLDGLERKRVRDIACSLIKAPMPSVAQTLAEIAASC
ncbi:phosphotransferase family protein [Thioalkalivibrio sp. HK1]|uniref:phosphotransferase family protein n=1 Tax=Thioalkalivibrio sp. HK1 TaxID=1469245 RepID=UPI00046FD565|nr:aminoglycoside phosphotransferase family protein [Thioalkalivibrio sp. HK1]